MKTLKSLFVLALFLFIAVFANAQAVSEKLIFPYPYGIPVECDGVPDVLIGEDGTVQTHWLEYYDKEDVLKWVKIQIHCEVTSLNTGEVFKVLEINKGNYKDGIWNFHYNILGNLGTHILLKGKMELPSFEIIEVEIRCK